MLTYFLQVNLCWLMFYGLYWALLSRETFFKLNRIYLIISLLCGLFLPLMANWIHQESSLIIPIDGALAPVFEYTFNYNGLATVDSPTLIPTVGTTWSWWVVIGSVYFVGVFMEIIRFLMGLYKVFSMYQMAQKEQFDGYTLVITEGVCMPFSFFNYIFIDSNLLQSADFQSIMQHEMAHVRQKHSWDIILLEIVNIVFWMSPCIYLYKKSLKNIHEYLADAAALRIIPKRQYGTLLIQHAQNSKMVSFVNPFFSQLKKRITMMTKSQSSRIALVKYTLVAPLFMVLTILFAAPKNGLLAKTEDLSKRIVDKIDNIQLETGVVINQSTIKSSNFQNNDIQRPINQDSVINPIDENTPIVQDFLKNSELYDVPPSYSLPSPNRSAIPQFSERNQRYMITTNNDPQCRLAGRTGGTISQWSFKNQTLLSITQSASSNRSVCAIQSFILVRKPFNKNESPRQSNNSGAKFSSYTQELIALAQNGDVYQFLYVKGRCPGDAVARDIGSMAFVIGENKIDSLRDIQGVNFMQDFNLSKISDLNKDCSIKTGDTGEMPVFPGGESEIEKFIYANLRYPEEAKRQKREGAFFISYVVGTDGLTSDVHSWQWKWADPRLLTGRQNSSQVQPEDKPMIDEAIRVIRSMPRWKPGTRNGVVACQSRHAIIKFQID